MLDMETLVHSTEVVPQEEDFKVVREVDADKQYIEGWLAEVWLTNLFHYGNEFGKGVRVMSMNGVLYVFGW